MRIKCIISIINIYLQHILFKYCMIMTKIEKIIKNREDKYFFFKPDKSFYEAVKINQKRWGQIYRNEIDPTITELRSIALFFNIELNELIS